MAAWRPCPPPPVQPLVPFPKAGPAAVGEARWDLETGNVVFWGAGAKLQRALCMLKPPQLALLEVNVICSCRRDEGKRDAVRWGSSFEVTEAVAVPMEVKPNLILGPPCCVTAVRFPAKALTFG